MPTSPAACPACRGSGRLLFVAEAAADMPHHLRFAPGFGFWRERCLVCRGSGAAGPPEPPGEYAPPPRGEQGG